MRLSTWVVLPVLALSTSALVIPATESSHDAIAGSIVHPNTTEEADKTIGALRFEYEKLEVFKHQLSELHHEVLKQEHEIFVLINKDFHSCHGVKCYLQTALKKAPDFFELFKTHFRHPKNAKAGAWSCPWTVKSSEDELPLNLDAEEQLGTTASPPPPPVGDDPFQFGDHEAPRPPPPLDDGLPDYDDGRPPPPPSPSEDRPSYFSPPPPRPPNHPAYRPWNTNPNRPAGHPHDDHKGPHHFSMPHPAPRHPQFRLIIATCTFVASALIMLLLFKAARIYFSNPRVRADCAAIREERRTRREYRRAACQHRFRQVLSRFGRRRRDSGTDDYEEKRAALQRTNSIDASNHIVGADINSLRRAHEIVGQLMRAEEGRIHNPLQYHPQQTSPEDPVIGSSRSVRSLNTTTTLPPYAPPPPRYSQELSRDMEVVNGFRYTPTQSDATVTSSASSFIINDDDLCTESSVVDCRSRMSMDTESVVPVQTRENSRNRKSLELAGDRFRGQYD